MSGGLRPYLSVIIPTAGKRMGGLARVVASVLLQGEAARDVEILIVGDTLDGPLPHVEAWVEARHDPRLRYLECAGEVHAWGQPQRQAGMEAARGFWLWWLADDDIATVSSIAIIKAAIARLPSRRPLFFQFMSPWRQVIWQPGLPQLLEGNIDANAIIVPNDVTRLGTWTDRYQGDFDFAAVTSAMYDHQVSWEPAIISWTRPKPDEDWTRHNRRALQRRTMPQEGEPPVRLNLGCGDFPLPQSDGWVNIDASPNVTGADLQLDVTTTALPFGNGTVEEVYAGHLLEHLTTEQVPPFLAEVRRVLVPGGTLGLVVPDTYEVMRRYVAGEPGLVEWPAGHFRDLRDLDDACAMILFSTEQESPHRWAYDLRTLRRTVERAGFTVTGEIDRHHDPRLGTGQWYQCGLDCRAPAAVPVPAPLEAPVRELAEVVA